MRQNKAGKHPPLSDTEAAERNIKVDRNGLVRCRVCGCTEISACNPPCGWADVDLCTGCQDAAMALVEWSEGAHRPNLAALLREYKRVAFETPRYQLVEKEKASAA